MSTYNDQLQGQSGPGFAWVLFDGAPATVAAAVSPRATSSVCFTFTDDDTRRVCTAHRVLKLLSKDYVQAGPKVYPPPTWIASDCSF